MPAIGAVREAIESCRATWRTKTCQSRLAGSPVPRRTKTWPLVVVLLLGEEESCALLAGNTDYLPGRCQRSRRARGWWARVVVVVVVVARKGRREKRACRSEEVVVAAAPLRWNHRRTVAARRSALMWNYLPRYYSPFRPPHEPHDGSLLVDRPGYSTSAEPPPRSSPSPRSRRSSHSRGASAAATTAPVIQSAVEADVPSRSCLRSCSSRR